MSLLLIALPALVWGLLVRILQRPLNWRAAILAASVLWGSSLTLLVEGLSILHSLTRPALLSGWLLIGLALYWIGRRQSLPFLHPLHLSLQIWQLPEYLTILLLGVGVIVGGTGLTAILAAPNNWDSMTYHLPRVLHWLQNHRVAHYPTANLRQLYQPPFAGYAILNFQILAGGDRFANLVQWLSSIGCLIGVSLLARELRASPLGQVFAVVYAATLPMGILQASSAQNDYICAFWLVCLSYFVVVAIRRSLAQSSVVLIGLSLGLVVLTKGTGYIFALPLMVWLFWARWPHFQAQPRLLLSIVSSPLLLNAGFYLRNLQLFGTPLATGQEQYTNELFTLTGLISNLVRNLALHLPLPLLNSEWVLQVVQAIHTFLGISTNDPRTSWQGADFAIVSISTFENLAPNPLHFYLLGGVFILGLWQGLRAGLETGASQLGKFAPIPRPLCPTWENGGVSSEAHPLGTGLTGLQQARKTGVFEYSLVILAMFVLFVFLLKWQPWNSRLHLPLFILIAPVVGKVLDRTNYERLTAYLSSFLLITALFWLLFNETRPLAGQDTLFNTPRLDQYFWSRPDLYPDYVAASQQIAAQNCPQVGLHLGGDDWEYPLWVLLAPQQVEIRSVGVENESRSRPLPNPQFSPCAILYLGATAEPELATSFGPFHRVWTGDSLRSSLSGQLLSLYEPRPREGASHFGDSPSSYLGEGAGGCRRAAASRRVGQLAQLKCTP